MEHLTFDDHLLTLQEAAERSQVSIDAIHDAINLHELRIIKFGPKTRRIHPTELDRWWKSKQTKIVPNPKSK